MRLLHAKNVHSQPHEPSKPMNRKRLRRGETPAGKYYTLVVSVPGQKVSTDTGTGQYLGLRPLHFCRGHFRYVSENRPLFGRPGCHGLFWIPAHVKGRAENGIVSKDYKIALREGV